MRAGNHDRGQRGRSSSFRTAALGMGRDGVGGSDDHAIKRLRRTLASVKENVTEAVGIAAFRHPVARERRQDGGGGVRARGNCMGCSRSGP